MTLINTIKKVKIGEKNINIIIRLHPRAKRMTLRYQYHNQSFLVVVPQKTPRYLISDFLGRHHSWIEKQLLCYSQPCNSVSFPKKLLVFGQLKEFYCQQGSRAQILESNNQVNLICPTIGEETRCLEYYLRFNAKDYFTLLAHQLAGKINKKVLTVRVKDQKTRWGSCSSTGAINLSWRLCLAPQEVADYVCSHEIAHLSEMNHSKKFWAIVESLCPSYRQNRLWLKQNGSTLFQFTEPNSKEDLV